MDVEVKNILTHLILTGISVEEPEDDLSGLLDSTVDVVLASDGLAEVGVRVVEHVTCQILQLKIIC